MERMPCRGALATLALASLALGCSRGDTGPAGAAGPTTPATTPATGQTGSNLVLTPTAARVTSDNHLQVDFKLADAAGNAAPSTGVAMSWTAAVLGTDATSGLPAWQSLVINPNAVKGAAGTTNQPTSDTKGTLDNLGGGSYRYTYASALPAGYDKSATYRAGVWAQRPLPGIAQPAEAPDYDVANGAIDFVPAGGTAQPKDLVSMDACNRCHGILGAHGGFRRDPRLCATCHTTQLFDPDTHDTGDPSQMNPLDLGRMVHRIHRGQTLPTIRAAVTAANKGNAAAASWAYHVIGFRSSDNVFAAVGKNPDPTAAAATPFVATGVGLPQDIRNCAACHSPAKDASGNVTAGAQASDWQTRISRRTCQSCHDSSWWGDPSTLPADGLHVMHQQATNPGVTALPGLPQPDDTKCANCHSSTLMQQAHQAPNLSPDFKPIVAKITSATWNGTAFAVAFTMTEADGTTPIDVTKLSFASTPAGFCQVSIGGPTSEYVFANQRSVSCSTATGAPGSYTITVAPPAGVTPAATDTWAVAIEARRDNLTLTAREKKLGILGGENVHDFADNPVAYVAIGGGKATPRRQVVAEQTCNGCHAPLSAHGDLRHNPEYCVMCHAPDATDAAAKTAAGLPFRPDAAVAVDRLPARDIHFKPFIHSLHTGENLDVQQPFVVYGFPGPPNYAPNFFNEARFPGNFGSSGRARCTMCHVTPQGGGATYTVNAIPAGAAPTEGLQWTPGTFDPTTGYVTAGGTIRDHVPPITAACVSCHDDATARAHMDQQSPPSGAELCSVCHGEGGLAAVSDVHRRFTR